jgi:hypothetical protein
MMSMFLERPRISIHRHYYRICREQHLLYRRLDEGLSQTYVAPVAEDEIIASGAKREEYYEKREQAAVIGITFAAMCLEAFFYDYAATKLGDSLAEDHLDKLDLPSKLLIVPWLVCGKAIDKSSVVYERVKRLSKDRNYLVHFKSKGFDLTDLANASEFHDHLNQRFRQALENGADAIPTVMKALGELHGTPDYYVGMVCG